MNIVWHNEKKLIKKKFVIDNKQESLTEKVINSAEQTKKENKIINKI
jgi:hypothetical protein